MPINASDTIHYTTFNNLSSLITSGKASDVTNQTSFANELNSILDTISQNQNNAHNQAKKFVMGDGNVSLNEVMVDMQKATVSLQFGIQVRNKLVAAYQEIMNMNV